MKELLAPWQTITADIPIASLQLTANTYGVRVEVIAGMLDEYIARFRQGPSVFWQWYHAQQRAWEEGDIAFCPWYPHEVFSALTDNGEWLYEEVGHVQELVV